MVTVREIDLEIYIKTCPVLLKMEHNFQLTSHEQITYSKFAENGPKNGAKH